MAQSFKTAISFGLVYVPVTLHACIKNDDLSFNTLYKKTGERIRYKKTCDNCPDTVPNEDIVRGYQYEKDKYVVLTDSELEKLKTPKDKSIEIEKFVLLDQIDPVYFDKSYFVKPTGAENAYMLIVKALEKQNKVGIAKTVLGTKEQLVAIRVVGGQMILNTMHFYDEVQASPVKNIKEKVSEKELSLAEMVVENMSGDFDIEQYKDEYKERVMAAIDDKIAGKKVKGQEEMVRPNNIINLMEALQKSVSQTQKTTTKAKKTTTKTKKKDNNITTIPKRA